MNPLTSRLEAANRILIEEGDLDAVADFFSSEYLVHLTDRDVAGGHLFVRRYVERVRTAFADLSVSVEVLLVGRDRIAWQRTFRGRHEGTYQGFPATGHTISWRDMATSRFDDELIVEEWVVSDLAERLLLGRKV